MACMTQPLRADEVAAALQAALERRQPDPAVVAAWNRDRHKRMLSSRSEGWPDPPDLVLPRISLWPGRNVASLQKASDVLAGRGYELVGPAEADLIVALAADTIPEAADVSWVLFDPSGADAAALDATFPRVDIQVLGFRGDNTLKARSADTAEEARKQIIALDDLNQFPEIRVMVSFTEPASATREPATPDLERLFQEIKAEAVAAASAAGVKVAPGEQPPGRFYFPEPARWPALGEQLRRARERNQAQHMDSWNEERLAARDEARAGGWREPPIIGSPRLFISYRWESEDHEAWVDRLAGELFSRGYKLVYDRHPESISNPAGADEVLYQIAECTCFVAIMTEQYLAATRLPSEGPAPWTRRDASWAKREWERARALHKLGVIDCVAVWRSGESPTGVIDWQAVMDCRAEDDVHAALDRVFPEFGVIAVATAADGQEYRTAHPVLRGHIRHIIEDLEERFAPQGIRLHAAKLTRRRWVALHSVEDSVTRERIGRVATLESLRDIEFRHVCIIDAEHEQRPDPASDRELDALISAAFRRLDQVVEASKAELVLTKFGVVAAARPDVFTWELRQFADTRPEVRVILLATQPGQVLGPLRGDQRPANLAILSEPLSNQALTDALACLFADRYAVGT
jgi:hypothetical protein